MPTDTMRAYVLTGHGGFERLEYHTDWPVPVPGPTDVLMEVQACGINNTDINTRTAWYSKGVTEETTGDAFDSADDDDSSWGGAAITFPRIQGADVVGVVVKTGPAVEADVARQLLGKRVIVDTWLRNWDAPRTLEGCGYYGSECDGGFAEYALADYRNVHPVETDLSDVELATFATAFITAENMLNRAEVDESDTVLITGASGGVGSSLIQLAKRRGATTIAMTLPAKADSVRSIGADYVIPRTFNGSADNLSTAIESCIGKPSVSVVADIVGGSQWPDLINCLQRGGRYTCSGAIGGPMVELDLRTFYLRDLTFTGATVVPPGVFADLVGYIERAEVKPALGAQWPLEKLIDAQKAFIEKQYTGNLVVNLKS